MSTERNGQVLMLCSLSRSCDLRTHKRVACHVPHLPVRGLPGYPDHPVSLVCHVFLFLRVF